jgi:hypothetical protein
MQVDLPEPVPPAMPIIVVFNLEIPFLRHGTR